MNRAWVFLLTMALVACTPAKSSQIDVQVLTAPDGARCYAIVQDGQVRGGSCGQ